MWTARLTTFLSSAVRLVGVLGLHGQCLSELAQLCATACSPPSLIRLLQFYSSWAQLRDTLLSGWTPLGESLWVFFTVVYGALTHLRCGLFQVWWPLSPLMTLLSTL